MPEASSGNVVAIYVAPTGGSPLKSIELALLEPGKGIAGDRYCERSGTFSEQLKGGSDWEVTLIESEEIHSYNEAQGTDWPDSAFRRNIVTQDIRLNDLVGRQFSIGAALLEGVRLCEPCAHLGSLLGREVVRGMAHRAGLRARILAGGDIRPGDRIREAAFVEAV